MLGAPAIRVGPRPLLPSLALRVLPLAGAVGAAALLAVRLAHDLGAKPYFEDEAVAGLVSSRPLGELLRTVVWDRGGSPLHFVLAHAVFRIEPTAAALRWLSVVCAVAAVLVAYALGRELAGRGAGLVAAWVTATSSLLEVYGTFGRMYALLVLVGGLDFLLFLRAVERPTARRVWLAAAGAWLLAATHPFAGLPVAVEALVGLVAWRRGKIPLAPLAVSAVAAIPLLAADVRLATRFGVSASDGTAIGSGGAAGRQLRETLEGFAGAGGWTLVLLSALGLGGFYRIARRRPAVALAGGAVLLPVALSFVARVQSLDTTFLSPRHLLALLPLFAAAVGVGCAELARRAHVERSPAVAVALAALVVVAFGYREPGPAPDPRAIPYWASTGDRAATAGAAVSIAAGVRPGDVLFPYAVPYLRALPATREARALPRGQPETLLDTLDRGETAPDVWIALPIAPGDRLVPAALAKLRSVDRASVFPRWLVVEAEGPFHGRRAIVAALSRGVALASASIDTRSPDSTANMLRTRSTVALADQQAAR